MTRRVFDLADKEKHFEASCKLMEIDRVGIAGATKLIGLSNQNKRCIYDSRVGASLKDLKKGHVRLIRCPPGRKHRGEPTTPRSWAKNYERLIWTLEIMQGYLQQKIDQSLNLRIGDIELALFALQACVEKS